MSYFDCSEMLAFNASSHHQQQQHQQPQQQQHHLARKLSSQQQQQQSPKGVPTELPAATHPYSSPSSTIAVGSPSHHIKSSPRKSNVKKTDSSIQTEASAFAAHNSNAQLHHQQQQLQHLNGSTNNNNNSNSPTSLNTWKRYLQEQHMSMKDSLPGLDVATSGSNYVIGSKLNNPICKLPSSETYGGSTESLRLKLANSKSSGGFPNGGKAVAVIRATAATTGRIPSGAKVTPGRIKQSKPEQYGYSGSDMIYSDTEYIQQQRQATTSAYYHHSKYSYLTSPVRLRNTNQGRVSSYAESAERFSRDSANYSQVLSPWLQRNGGFPMGRNAMTEAESMESLSSNLSRRPNSVANKANPDISGLSSRLNNMPSTPTRSKFNRLNIGGISSNMGGAPNSSSTTSGNPSMEPRKTMDKDGEIYASALSLASNATMFSNAEDKQAQEIRRLRRELEQANEKVSTLTSQLNTNAHMVSAFEQSLSTMTARLQQLSNVSHQKDSELQRLKSVIDELNRYRRKKDGGTESVECTPTKSKNKEDKKSKKSLLIRRHTFASTSDELRPMPKHRSIESLSSGSDRETHSHSKQHRKGSRKHTMDTVDGEPITVSTSKGWFRNSITKAFRKSKSSPHKCRGSMSDVEIIHHRHNAGSGHEGDSSSVPNSPVMPLRVTREIQIDGPPADGADIVEDLKRQLREKEKILIDLRLDSLTSAHQLESFKEMINKMRSDMMNLKQDNDRLHRLVVTKSLASSKSSVLSGGMSPGEQNQTTNGQQQLQQEQTQEDQDENFLDNGRQVGVNIGSTAIGNVVVTPETTWGILDALIRKALQDFLDRIDPDRSLGLSIDSLAYYEVGSERQIRSLRSSTATPELLPFGYIVNESRIIVNCRSHIESFVFESLIPKTIIQRFVGLLSEHRRIILYGPSGTGKTYLAQKLAEYLVIKIQRGDRLSRSSLNGYEEVGNMDSCPPGAIASFNIDQKSAKELKAYLATLGEQFESETPSQDLPNVIILDNLHHVTSIEEVFNGFLSINHVKCPYIIATMCQTNSSATNLQLNHNFRWLLCANHMEPVRGFISRYLRRKLVMAEIEKGSHNLSVPSGMIQVIDWIPKVWNHINHFLEVHHSSDVTIGPRIFIACPTELEASQVWFNDLWNYSLAPYLMQASRDGAQKHGNRAPFEDPTEWILKTYPWSKRCNESLIDLIRIRAEDVVQPFDVGVNNTISNPSTDPLSDMLLRLQVAAKGNNDSSQEETIKRN